MIPFFDLASQQLGIKSQIDQNISSVLSHGNYILGPEVYELEDRLADYTGSKYCITCANGTDALQIALMAIDICPGDEVIVPGFSYIATAEAVALLGAVPIYVDVDFENCNLSYNAIDEKITNKTKAIIAVSLFGKPANFNEINAIASKYRLIVIEDAAQSFGSSYFGRKSCNLSTIACTSFFPTKPLGCYGDGGAIFTSDPELASIIRKIARHGQTKKYYHEIIGINSRLDTIQAAVLLAKLEILDWEIHTKKKVAKYYNQNLAPVHNIDIPEITDETESAWALYTLKFRQRSKNQAHLTNMNIPSVVYYPLPLYKQQALLNNKVLLANTETLCAEVLSIPIHAYLNIEMQDQIINAISNFNS